MIRVNGQLVWWYCRKQSTVALSSTEAEYMALSDAVREILYVYQLMKDLLVLTLPVVVHVDNQGAAFIAEKEVNNKLTKHIDVRFHFVRQYIADKIIDMQYIPTALNVADIFTKPLDTVIFARLCELLMPQ